jgi:hypothetical protein
MKMAAWVIGAAGARRQVQLWRDSTAAASKGHTRGAVPFDV